MSDELNDTFPEIEPSGFDIRSMTRTTVSLILLYIVVVFITPPVLDALPEELFLNVTIQNRIILRLAPVLLFLLKVSEKTVVLLATIDTILNKRSFLGLIYSFKVYIWLGGIYLLLVQFETPTYLFCVLTLTLATVGAFWCYFFFIRSNGFNPSKVFFPFSTFSAYLTDCDKASLDKIAILLSSSIAWVVSMANLIALIVYFIVNRQRIF